MAKLVYTYKSTELLRCNNATRYPDIGETVTIKGVEYEVTAVHGTNDTGTATVILCLPGKHSVTHYYAGNMFIATNKGPLPCHGDRTTINGIHYHVVGVEPSRVDIELYAFPTTLTGYLLMLHTMTESQFDQWIESLSHLQLNTWNVKYRRRDKARTVQGQLAAYQCTVDCGTIVYYHNERWEAYNAKYAAIATASTLAELLNYWAEATEHVRYELPE